MKKIILTVALVLSTAISANASAVIDGLVTKSEASYRAQIDVVEKYSTSNFMKAVAGGNVKLVETYIKAGMSPNATQAKLSASIVAIGSKQPEVLDVLLKNGANPEQTSMGITPLMFAVNRKNADCVKVLISHKADVNNGFDDISPLYSAVAKKQYDIARMLIAAGAKVDHKTVIKTLKSKDEDLKQLVVQTAANQN